MKCAMCNDTNAGYIVNYSETDRRFVCFDCADAWTTQKYGWNEPYDKKQTNIDSVEYTEIYDVELWPDDKGPDMFFCQK